MPVVRRSDSGEKQGKTGRAGSVELDAFVDLGKRQFDAERG